MQILLTLPWWASLLIVIVLVGIIHLVVGIIYKYHYPKLVKKGQRWLALMVKTLYKPFCLFLWFVGLSVLTSLYANHFFEIGVVVWIQNLLQVGIILAVSWGFYIFATGVEYFLSQKFHFDQTTMNFLSKLTFIAVALFSMLLILPLFGMRIGGLLAFGGIGAIIVGFAAKEALANVLGGFLVAVDRPFRIGDWIYSVDGSMEGYVEQIGWRLTMIRTFEKRLLYIPNSLFTSLCFVNATQMTHRRIQTTIGIRFQDIDKIPNLIKEIRSYVTTHGGVDHNQFNYVHINNLGILGCEVLIRAYTKTVEQQEYLHVQEEILLNILQIIKKHDAEITFPTTTTKLSFEGAFGKPNELIREFLDKKMK